MTEAEKKIIQEIKIRKWNVSGISFDLTKKIIRFDILKKDKNLNERITVEGWEDMDFLEALKVYQKRA